MPKKVRVADFYIGHGEPLVLIAGPCVIESEEETIDTALEIKKMTGQLEMPFVFKSSFYKDNRSLHSTYSGPGLEKGLEILKRVKEEVGVPVISDVHSVNQVKAAAEVLDIVQIPAFLCRQTSLAIAVGKANKPTNIKKSQFLSPRDMKSVIEKFKSTKNDNILITERGTSFGYNNLVVDMRSLPLLRKYGYPVVFDIAHTVRNPGIPSEDPKGGRPELALNLIRAAVANGIDALFLETHLNPKRALCDSSSMIKLSTLPGILKQVKTLDDVIRKWK